MISVDDLIADARTWKGVPFHHQGRSRAGIDCVGLWESLLRDRGLLPDGYISNTKYGREPSAELAAALDRWCQRVAVPVRGVLLGIQWPRARAISHIALFTGTTMIHTYAEHGVCEHAYSGRWVRMTRGYWKLPGVIYE